MWLQFSILEMWLPPWTSHLPHPWNWEEHRPSTPLKDLMFLRAKQLWKRKMSWPSLPESLTTAGGHQHPAFYSGTFQVLWVQGNVWWQPGVWFWKTLWPVDRISGQFRPHNCRRFSKGRPLCPGKRQGKCSVQNNNYTLSALWQQRHPLGFPSKWEQICRIHLRWSDNERTSQVYPLSISSEYH